MIHGAEVRIAAKKWEEARIFLLEEALPQYPENAELWYWLGVTYAQGTQRDSEEAAKAFAKARELADPGDAELIGKLDAAVQASWGPLVNAGAKALEEGRLEEAEASLVKATEIKPDGPEAWINLAAVYTKQDKKGEAAAAYEKALALEAENDVVLYNLAVTYHQLGRDAKAAGDEARHQEFLGKAEKLYNAYKEKKPDDPAVLNNLASLYQERGDDAKMREALSGAMAADSVTQESSFEAGRAFLRAKDYQQAEAAFTKTVEMTDESNPTSVEIRGYALESLGLVLIQQGKHDQAIEVLNRLISQQPDLAIAHEYLGYAYRDSGRKDEAIAAFARAEELKKAGGGEGASTQ
jgi:tetratricopeptide (TPR) repeat protein